MRIWDFFRKLFSKTRQEEIEAPKQQPETIEKPEERFILCLDGGGMRGIVTVAVLKALRQKLTDIGCGKSLAACFDLIAGTSTGGLIALALSCPSVLEHVGTSDGDEVDLDALIETYRTMGDEIFPNRASYLIDFLKAKRYPVDGIENLLESWFGNHTLSEAKTPTLIMAQDLAKGEPVLLRSWEDMDFPVWKAGRATSAAPTYFKPFPVDGMILADGGVVANNPSVYAYAQARRLYPNCRIFHLLSISTGGKPQRLTIEDTERGIVKWADRISPMYLTAQKYTTDYTMSLFDDVNYIRIDDEMDKDIDMDETNPRLISEMEEFGYSLGQRHDSELGLFAQRIAGVKGLGEKTVQEDGVSSETASDSESESDVPLQ